MTVKAINNYLILDMDVHQEEAGLSLPGHLEPQPRWGRVLSVGPGVPTYDGKLLPCEVQEGDLAYIAAHGIEPVQDGSDNKLHCASELDALAVFKDDMIQPLGNYLLIEKSERKAHASGLSLPESQQPPINVGRVLKLGKGLSSQFGEKIPFQVAEGDEIVYLGFQTQIVDMACLGEEKKYTLISHANVLGIVQE